MMSTENKAMRAVFVDRDGTLIKEVDHLSDLKDLVIFPYTAEALDLFKASGFLVIVLTNQSGVGRGYFSESDMHAIHRQIKAELGDRIDGFYYCPHHPEDGCSCRKPNLGMIEAACADFEIDLAGSWMVGDKRLDMETGHNAGIGTAMVLTGYGADDVATLDRRPNFVADDLLAVAKKIVTGSVAAI